MINCLKQDADRLNMLLHPIVACTGTSAQHCAAKTSVSREADFPPDLQPHVFKGPAKSEDRSS